MDTSEFIHQVSILLEMLQDPKNIFLGKEYTILSNKRNVIETLVYEPAREGERMYTTKLMATASPNTRARITMPLLDKLGTLKMEGPGGRVGHQGVEWWFVVEDGEPRSPSYSSEDEDEAEDEG